MRISKESESYNGGQCGSIGYLVDCKKEKLCCKFNEETIMQNVPKSVPDQPAI